MEAIFILTVAAAAVLTLAILAFLIRNIMKKRYEKAIVDYQNKLLSQEMEEVRHIYKTMRGWRHDYHNHMQSVKACLAGDNIGEARRYLDALEKGIPCDYKAVIIVTILMMFLVYGVLNGVYTYLNGRNDMAYIAVRSSYHEMPYLEKHMDISLEQLPMYISP